ncbi:hypothetical protein CWB96_03750 [Pseudoalteromonas citrea]|uniref:HTH cro/C1-type domain-containing protein n=1 Tax=Pseudoalteromonas citrea TaxID=43655 RepID=A0A5S3XT03_9GAMM|nr:helix-turn-helix transcriptional regulator [Pseudoalteromonas citrea]TMP45209.1 hypothetical protein CWB97_05260 [Pseudoalteromonas citrea]TMP61410.1 hypothetical protein CWB96_03750 [Pseudoalteromonas citrea]
MINGDDLKAMRLNAGITQQGMSKKLDCDRRTIHNYELGVSDIPSARLFQWFKYCKLDISVLLNQIKAVRGEASKNGTSKLLDVISVILIFSSIWSADIITPIYLLILLLCAGYSAYNKNFNIVHIILIIFTMTLISHMIFNFGIINSSTPEENKILQSALIYGVQLLFNFLTAISLIFRVQISRAFSKSASIELTPFDGIFYWYFFYMAIINSLALLEEIAYTYYGMSSWTLIYNNFEGLIYISWALCFCTLFTMMFTTHDAKHNKGNEKQGDAKK